MYSSRLLPNSWITSEPLVEILGSPQNTSEILGHEYEVVRHSTQAEANVQNPSQLQVE